MRKFMINTMLIALLAATQAMAADSSNVYQTTLMEAGQATTEVSTEELQQILKTGSAIVFDARPQAEFAMSHIPGARNVAQKAGQPLSQYTSDVAEIGRLISGDRATAMVLYCNGPYCGKSKRLAADLLAAGYTKVRRYQLGMPVWRALVGIAQIEWSAVQQVYAGDDTAMFVDARPDISRGTLVGSQHIPVNEVLAAKDDGRLPMEDHNTRIIVFGENGGQASEVATALAKNAFANVTFFDGSAEQLLKDLRAGNHMCPGLVFERQP